MLQKLIGYGEALAGVALVTLSGWLLVTRGILDQEIITITAGFGYLLAVLITASRRGLAPSIFASVIGVICFDFFCTPPLYVINAKDPHYSVALTAFLVTAIVASRLWAASRTREQEARRNRDQILKLYRLSCSIIVNLNPADLITYVAPMVLEAFGNHYCGVFQKKEDGWKCLSDVHSSTPASSFEPSTEDMETAYRTGRPSSVKIGVDLGRDVFATYISSRVGIKVIAVLVLVSNEVEMDTVEAIASLVALALERARLLDETRVTDALKRSDELKSALLASVSHNLRTPLTAIRASVDSILAAHADDADPLMRELHMIISDEVSRLTRVVEHLLEMARVESGELRLKKEWTPLSEIIDNALHSCAAALPRHKIVVDCADTLPLIHADPRMLTEVLANLIDNAAKYSPAGSEIAVSAALDGDSVRIAVADHGPGIPGEELERVFDKFYRGKLPAQQMHPGTGMGLAIARGLVRAHSGKIWVESIPGGGATFVFTVPVEVTEPANFPMPMIER
jgi:two-component system sensor histidine kinase KdpD